MYVCPFGKQRPCKSYTDNLKYKMSRDQNTKLENDGMIK